jgi:hypothetical protein
MILDTLNLPKVSSGNVGRTTLRAAEWLSLGPAPAFAFMAALTGISGRGAHETLCAMAIRSSPLSGMVPMYALMSAFHCGPWLRLIFRARSNAQD